MASSREIVNHADIEAQIPKQKKRKKKQTPVQALMADIQLVSPLLNLFKAMSAEKIEEVHFLLHPTNANLIFRFFNEKDILSYSLLSKQAYVNIQSNDSFRFTIYGKLLKKKLEQGNQLIMNTEKEAHENLELYKRICSPKNISSSLIGAFILILLAGPGGIVYASGNGLEKDAIRHNNTQAEDSAKKEKILGLTLIFALPILGLALWIALARCCKASCHSSLKESNQDRQLFGNFPRTIKEPEDLLRAQNALTLFNPRHQETKKTGTEKTPLLKKG